MSHLTIKNVEGLDISGYEHVVAIINNHHPVFSEAFMAEEGFLGVSIGLPLFNSKGEFTGFISLLLNPSLIIETLLDQVTMPESSELWIMQTDGLVIYDHDSDEIGRNLLSDPMYTDFQTLQNLGKNIAESPEGTGEYIFYSHRTGEKVLKNAVWKTMTLSGKEWRIVITE